MDKVGHVELVDGSVVWIQGMAPWSRFKSLDRGGVDRMLAEMNEEARRLKESNHPTAPVA